MRKWRERERKEMVCKTLAEENQGQLSGHIDAVGKQTQAESLSSDFLKCIVHTHTHTHSPDL